MWKNKADKSRDYPLSKRPVRRTLSWKRRHSKGNSSPPHSADNESSPHVHDGNFSSSTNGIECQGLIACIVYKKWMDATLRIAVAPHEACEIDEHGWTPLHWCCSRDPPTHVVGSLLDVYPEATSLRDEHGYTPLAYACYRSSYHVVRRLLESDRDSVYIRNKCWSEMSASCEWHKERNDEGNSLLSDFCNSSFHREKAVQKTISSCRKSVEEWTAWDRLYTTLWAKACLIVQAMYHGTIDGEDHLHPGRSWLVVHACAALRDVSENMLRIAVATHIDQLTSFDEKGRLPLHHVADTSSRDNGGLGPRVWDDGSRAVLDAHPSGALVLDRVTGLYPFMMAAVGKHSSLSAAYEILRSCPELERMVRQSRGP